MENPPDGSTSAPRRASVDAPVQVLLVERRSRSLDWLAGRLTGLDDLNLAARASGLAAAAAALREHEPDIVLLELGEDEHAGFELVRRLREHRDDVRIILVEGTRASAAPRAAVACGASGVLSSRLAAQPPKLVGAIEVVLGGGYVSAGV